MVSGSYALSVSRDAFFLANLCAIFWDKICFAIGDIPLVYFFRRTFPPVRKSNLGSIQHPLEGGAVEAAVTLTFDRGDLR